jgi:hypothetical protein
LVPCRHFLVPCQHFLVPCQHFGIPCQRYSATKFTYQLEIHQAILHLCATIVLFFCVRAIDAVAVRCNNGSLPTKMPSL